jgi:periplasmic divalent cation tolerance protein
VLALHPYDLPEVIAVPIEQAHAPYLDWVRDAVKN